MHCPGGGKAEARGPAVSESVLCLCPSAVRDAPARSPRPMLTCCLTGTTVSPGDSVRNIISPPHSKRESLEFYSCADNPSAVSRPLALRCCYILILFSKALVPKPWCLNPLFLWLRFSLALGRDADANAVWLALAAWSSRNHLLFAFPALLP